MKVKRFITKAVITMMAFVAACEVSMNEKEVMAAEVMPTQATYTIEADSSNTAIEKLEKAKEGYVQVVEMDFERSGFVQEVIAYDRAKLSDFGCYTYKEYLYSHGKRTYVYTGKELTITYDIDNQAEAIVDAYVAQTMPTLQGNSDYETICNVHDFICNLVTYDYETAAGNGNNYKAYSAVSSGKAVCSGYAQLFQKYMEVMQIESFIVSSKEFNHAWNIVKLDGAWYHIDCTWDDQESRISRDYFLLGSNGVACSQTYQYETVGNVVLSKENYMIKN